MSALTLAAAWVLTACGSPNEPSAGPSLAPPNPAPTAAPAAVVRTPDPTPSPIPTPDPYTVRKLKVTSISPNSGKYGVAIPITVTFNRDVPVRHRDDLERMVRVDASTHVPHAAWSWTDGHTMVLRSKDFWPARTTITVDANLDGQTIIDDKRRTILRLIGGDDITVRVGRELLTKVNAKTHQMTVFRDGEKVKTMPTSLGKPGFLTRSGIKVVHEGYEAKRMTSQALGLTDETYDLIAPYSVRLTPTGEFIHGAPWALGRLGRTNGSHGCTNLSVPDAKWFYDASRMGDPVITTGTGRRMESWNGWGGPWNVKWNKWLASSGAGDTTLGPPAEPDPATSEPLLADPSAPTDPAVSQASPSSVSPSATPVAPSAESLLPALPPATP